MAVLEAVTCCILAILTCGVFRNEILYVKDAAVGFVIPQKKDKKTKDKKKSKEVSNKENVDPVVKTTKQLLTEKSSGTNLVAAGGGGLQLENSILKKEEIITTESTTKVTEQTDGMRIKSVSVQPEPVPTFLPEMHDTTCETQSRETTKKEVPEMVPISNVISPPRSDHSLFDTSTKSVSEEVSSDDRKFEKTTTESVHEKRGNTETTFLKKEHESIIRDGDVKFNDLGPMLANGHVNFDTSTMNKMFDINGPRSMGESRTFTSVESSTVKETSTSYQEDSQSNMSDIISSLGLKAPFSDVPKDSIFSTSMANATMDQPRISMDTDSIDQKNTEGLFSYSESALVTKKKKMFSSSSFYEEPEAIYPTVEEQVEMAKKIADSLADDTNRKSKGANMFFKRVKRSTKWVHEGPEPSDESEPTTPEVQGVEPPTPDPSKVPWKSKQGVTNLKLVLDPRHTEDAMTLKSSGHNISEHNVVSPDICHDLVRDLESPVGKGAALFAKRKKKSSEWVVDEEKVRNLMMAHGAAPQPCGVTPAVNKVMVNPRVKLLKSPWEAALASPIGSCDAAFFEVHRSALAESVIRAADNKLQDSVPEYPSQEIETCRSPVPVTPAAAYYEIYKPKAPKGWNGVPFNPESGSSFSLPAQSAYTTNDSTVENPVQKTASLPRKMVFHNFNATPRKWKSPDN